MMSELERWMEINRKVNKSRMINKQIKFKIQIIDNSKNKKY